MEQWYGRSPTGTQDCDERRGCDQHRLLAVRTRPDVDVARGRPAEELRPDDEPGFIVAKHECPIGKLVELHSVTALLTRIRRDALGVELLVDRIGSGLAPVELAPDLPEVDVILPPAESARSMAGGERRRLVQEEELGEAAGLE
jgi:hypothetical protein